MDTRVNAFLKSKSWIVIVVILTTLMTLAGLQWKSLQQVKHQPFSLFGKVEDDYQLARQFTQVFVKQWQKCALEDKPELMQQWYALDSVLFIAVYDENAHLVHQIPQQSSLKTTLKLHPFARTTSLTSINQDKDERIIMVTDLEKLTQLNRAVNKQVIRLVAYCCIISLLIGLCLPSLLPRLRLLLKNKI